MKKVLIGVAGPIGSGKDTVIEIASSQFDDIVMVAWSDDLYQEVSEGFSVNQSLLRERKTKETPSSLLCIERCNNPEFIEVLKNSQINVGQALSPRQVLRLWGTEYRRVHYGYDYWVNKTVERVAKSEGKVFMISGTRFDNEVAAIRERGGFVLHISRPGHETEPGHESEIEVPFHSDDARLDNSGSIEELKLKVNEFGIQLGWTVKTKKKAMVGL